MSVPPYTSPSTIHLFFFFNDTATTEIYTLSLHDALPISPASRAARAQGSTRSCLHRGRPPRCRRDRKSTRLNSSHQIISYAVFCLKKKNKAANTSLENSAATTLKPPASPSARTPRVTPTS